MLSFRVPGGSGHIKKTIGDRVCLIGSISPLQILREGTPEDVDEVFKAVIRMIGTDGGLIVAAGDYISEGTPLVNIDAMIRACEKYRNRDQIGSLSSKERRTS